MDKLIKKVKAGGRLVVVLRGVSGAGKSTLAGKLRDHAPGLNTAVSADSFFTDEDGNYKFDPAKLGEAHGACLKEFVRTLQVDAAYEAKDSLIVVDNTNTTVAEAAPYMAFGAAYGWETLLVTVMPPSLIEAAARNVHGVPVGGVIAQGERLAAESARLPPFWAHVEVTL
jgi:hypothetical protein